MARALKVRTAHGLVAAAAIALQLPTAIPQTKFASGQDVVPYFEGWIRNKDGTFDLVFGYFNRNWQQELAIPAGPDNAVDLGGPDRGQPTYFLARRQGWVFRVRVPGDFGKQVVTWTIKANGKIERAYGELLPVEEITERIVMTHGNLNPGDDDPNKPPTISVERVAVSPGAATLTVHVSDDGLPKPRTMAQKASVSDATKIQAQANSSGGARPRGLTVSWMELRGPGKVVFDQTGPISVTAKTGGARAAGTPVAGTQTGGAPTGGEGKSGAPVESDVTVQIHASVPGTYVLRASANDGALTTTTDVTVGIPASPGGAQ